MKKITKNPYITMKNGYLVVKGKFCTKTIKLKTQSSKKIKTLQYKHKLNKVWRNMLQRCNYVKDKSYELYGGRGITVCDDWKNFDIFLQDMIKDYQPGLTLDRINSDGNYCKENCRWATWETQQKNRIFRKGKKTIL